MWRELSQTKGQVGAAKVHTKGAVVRPKTHLGGGKIVKFLLVSGKRPRNCQSVQKIILENNKDKNVNWKVVYK